MRIATLIAVLSLGALGACATTDTVQAPTALNGRELDTALNLYGKWDEKIVLNGRPHYIWRRAILMNGQNYYCELRSEVGYRNIISDAVVEGYPAACSLFSIRYDAGNMARREEPPKTQVVASRTLNYRPVGGQVETASAASSGEDASARPGR